jgi:hypothetical protein
MGGRERPNGRMSWTLTLTALAVCCALSVLSGWLGARPPNLARGPRLIPYRFLMLVAGAVALMLLIHVKTLAGLGRD